MEVWTQILGEIAANCHIVDCGDVCAAVDIGNDPEKLLAFLEKNRLKLDTILLTHGHYDHVGGVEKVRLATGAKVYIHENDAVMLQDGRANLSWQISVKPFIPVSEYEVFQDGKEILVGNRIFRILHTPGHTKGSVCYLSNNLMFSGDTLFKGSAGRTDLGGDPVQMQASLQLLSRITDNYEIYPGHFESTTLAFEKRTNPYLRNI